MIYVPGSLKIKKNKNSKSVGISILKLFDTSYKIMNPNWTQNSDKLD